MSEPVIFTSKGSMPESALREAVVWTDNADETICAVEHWLEDECVKRAVHIYKRTGASVLGQAGVI